MGAQETDDALCEIWVQRMVTPERAISREKKQEPAPPPESQDMSWEGTLNRRPSACPAPAQVQQLWSLVITAASLASSRDGGGVAVVTESPAAAAVVSLAPCRRSRPAPSATILCLASEVVRGWDILPGVKSFFSISDFLPG